MASIPPGTDLIALDVVDSTSSEALRQAQAGHPGPLWITAARQTAGRGRRGRAWVSEPGNLYATLLLRPDWSAREAGKLSFLAALALHRTLRALIPASHTLAVKWPNDLLVDGAKIAGILLESQGGAGAKLDWLTIGIGVNLAHAPSDVERPALALKALDLDLRPEEVLGPLMRDMQALLDQARGQGFDPILQAWREVAIGIGAPIRVRLANQELTGIFAGLDPEGALVLDQGGARVLIAAGDVFLS